MYNCYKIKLKKINEIIESYWESYWEIMKLFFNRWFVMIEFIIIFRCFVILWIFMLFLGILWNDIVILNIFSCDIGWLGIYIRFLDYLNDLRVELVSIFIFC